jgi:hypothetical protein
MSDFKCPMQSGKQENVSQAKANQKAKGKTEKWPNLLRTSHPKLMSHEVRTTSYTLGTSNRWLLTTEN